jgi:hypothetical protein
VRVILEKDSAPASVGILEADNLRQLVEKEKLLVMLCKPGCSCAMTRICSEASQVAAVALRLH